MYTFDRVQMFSDDKIHRSKLASIKMKTAKGYSILRGMFPSFVKKRRIII